MKIGDLIIGVLLGLLTATLTHSCVTNLGPDESEIKCDAIEEARLKIALTECSDIVFTRAWEDNGIREEN